MCLIHESFGSPYIQPIKILLDSGFDVSLLNSRSIMSWHIHKFDFVRGDIFPSDPFYLEVIRNCVTNDPGFGETTSPMEAVLLGSDNDLDR
ncbi:hypothetical protein EV356DRAFT_509518 [Viridothelium virens]|uniref:Uncharacterized protein n=1 Tax=Viridothelium virens TaxID=1048519 RepID=A0A6A6GW24_VIRVR|nr:hypothetical protein EV356DRAFT_509518 [Viridothelium virens]